jgi:hypothetical protein
MSRLAALALGSRLCAPNHGRAHDGKGAAMTVYVDDMYASFGRMKMCHMIADSRAELDAMADAIGVARRWIQKPGKPDEHYDVAMAARAKAVALGAKEITLRELAAITYKRRGSGARAEEPT